LLLTPFNLVRPLVETNLFRTKLFVNLSNNL